MTADLEWMHRVVIGGMQMFEFNPAMPASRQTIFREGCHLGRKARRKQKTPSRLRQEFAPSSLKRLSSRESGYRNIWVRLTRLDLAWDRRAKFNKGTFYC